MSSISQSVRKLDHLSKISGAARYVEDIRLDGMLYGKIVRSTVAHGKITAVHLPEMGPEYAVVQASDIPGVNQVHIVGDDHPVFSNGEVNYIGEAILMIVGPDKRQVGKYAAATKVDYELLDACFDPKKSDKTFYEYAYEEGDWEKAFEEADEIIDDEIFSAHQEHAYMEVQGLIGDYRDGKLTVRGSMQCPFYVHTAVTAVMGMKPEDVNVIADDTGGGFGGKEDYPSILGSQVGVASYKTGRPVKCVFDRREDITCTSKRHPAFMRYRMAIKDGKITAVDTDILYDGGGYTTLSMVVLQRGLIGALGIYKFPRYRVHGKAVKTHTVPNGAFRGFGGPQTFFAMELMMNHAARRLGKDPLVLRKEYCSKKGDVSPTHGVYHFEIPIPDMLEQIAEASDYYRKAEAYKNQSGRYRRGIGISSVYHGCGFTGAGERDLIKAVFKLHKRADDTVEILAAAVDMGQGVKTAFRKIAASVLDLPVDRVIIVNPDTDRVPNSGPTVASRSVMVVGKLIERAAKRLKADWKPGEDQLITEHYVHPDFMVPWDLATFSGDPYPDSSWSTNVVEVEVDTLLGLTKVLNAWGCYDVGTVIDENIVIGQMEGGLLQSIGHGGIELINYDQSGRIRNNSLSDYIVPTALDVPSLHVMFHKSEYVNGPFGAKAAGELPNVGGSAAYIGAMESALGTDLYQTPFSTEDTMQLLEERRNG